MEEEAKGAGHAAEPRQEAAEGAFTTGWVTTEDAAAALGVSPRTIREYIRSGGLEAKSEGAGVLKRWLVSKGGVQAMLKKRRSLGEIPVDSRESAAGPSPATEGPDAASGESAAGSSSAAEGAVDAAGSSSAAEGAADSAGGESPAEGPDAAGGDFAAGPPSAAEGAADSAEPTMAALQNLQYRLGHAEARLELAEQAATVLQAELDRLLEDLKRERKRAETERERVEEFRYIVHRLQGQEFEARQKAERREWERDRAREEARGLRDELEAERGRGLKRVVIAVLLVIFVVAAVAIMAGTVFTSWV